jgi:hypothetical protein
MKSSYIKLIGPVVSLMLITGNVLGQSVPPPMTVAALQVAVSNLQVTVTELRSRLQYVSRVGNDMYITNANLHIESGSGTTYGPTNGLGNLIVGYNESRAPYDVDNRTGSHNIVVGVNQNFSSFGGLVAGVGNTISGAYASVSGGHLNAASGSASSASGGEQNIASGDNSSVSGGRQNTASGINSSVSGGQDSTANSYASSVSGGARNAASGLWSSVSGGHLNAASGDFSSVSGGNGVVQNGLLEWSAGTLTSP